MNASDELDQLLHEHFGALFDDAVPAGFVDDVHARAVVRSRRTRSISGRRSLAGAATARFDVRPRLGLLASLVLLVLALVVGGLVAGALLTERVFRQTGDLRLTEVGRMGEPRVDAIAIRIANGRVLVAGGARVDAAGDEVPLDTAEVFDPATGTWAATGSMSEPRIDAAAAMLPDGRVIVTGGTLDRQAHGVPTGSATAEIWDPATGTFSPTGPMLQGRSWHTATTLSDGRVLITGGLGVVPEGGDTSQLESIRNPELGGSGSLRSAEIWQDGAFSAAGAMLGSRFGQVALRLPGDDVLILGGRSMTGPPVGISVRGASSTTELWIGATAGFSEAESSRQYPGVSGGALLLPDGRMVLCCATRDGEDLDLLVFPPGDMTATELPVPSRWESGPRVALHDGRIMNAWSVGNSQVVGEPSWGVDALDLSTGSITTITPDAAAASGTSDTAPERQVWGAAVVVGLEDGSVLMAGGYVASGSGEGYQEIPSDRAYIVAADPGGR